MTEFDIQDSLFKKFLTLDDFARENGYTGEPFLDKVEVKTSEESVGKTLYEKVVNGEIVYKNVHFPNIPFELPNQGGWFDLTFRNNEPESAAITKDAQNRFTGVLYIDIYSPTDSGEAEVRNKYEWIARLFERDLYFDDVVIMRCYISTKGNDAVSYRLQAAVEWTADIDKE